MASTPTALAELQDVVLDEYRQSLRVADVALDDEFVVLGGDSIGGARLATRLSRRLGLRVNVSAVLRHRTPRRLAARLHASDGATAAPLPNTEAGLAATRADRFPLSSEQHLVWFQQQLFPNSQAYTSHAVLRFDGTLDIDALHQALRTVVGEHDVLRSRVTDDDGAPYQVIEKQTQPDFARLDVPAELPDDALREYVLQQFRVPFNLERGPLVRWRLVSRGEDLHYLLHSEHHLVHDGLTFGLIAGHVLDTYAYLTGAGPEPVDRRPHTAYAEYVRWQQQWLKSTDAERSLEYWREKLAGSSMLPLMTRGRTRPQRLGQQGSALRFSLSPELLEHAYAFARKEGTTLFSVLFAGFSSMVAQRAGAHDVNIASSFANRPSGMEDVVGMFVNNVVLRMPIDGEQTGSQRLTAATGNILEALEHQGYPFTALVRELEPPRSTSFNPLAQLCFSFDQALDYTDWQPDLRVQVKEGVTIGFSKFDMNVICVHQRRGSGSDGRERVSVKWEYSAELFDQHEIRELVECWLAWVVALCLGADRPLGETVPAWSGDPLFHMQDRVFPDAGLLRGLTHRDNDATPEALA